MMLRHIIIRYYHNNIKTNLKLIKIVVQLFIYIYIYYICAVKTSITIVVYNWFGT